MNKIRSDEISFKIRNHNGFAISKKHEIAARVSRKDGGKVNFHSGRILNLSSHSAKLSLDSKLEIGDAISLTIQVTELCIEITTTSVISWSGTRGDGNWYFGCELVCPLAENAIQRLVDTGYLERRSGERHTISAKARIMRLKRPVRRVGVRLDDYSKGGFRIVTELMMELGDRFILETTCDDSTIQIPGEVCWCKNIEIGFLIGCKFLTGTGYNYLPVLPDEAVPQAV